METKNIKYPYIPKDRTILYVPEDNEFMQAAKKYAKENSLDKVMPSGTVIVKGGEIIGWGANGSDYHDKNGCERVKRGIPTGQGYELCEGCHPRNHGEPKAIMDTKEHGEDTHGADVYLWGHWWCCESCWNAMIEAGIKNIYLLKDSEILFNKADTNNIVGHQFDK